MVTLNSKNDRLMAKSVVLNLVKTWDYYNTTTAGGFMSVDDNYTIYTHNYKDPKIYKKQFVDQTEG